MTISAEQLTQLKRDLEAVSDSLASYKRTVKAIERYAEESDNEDGVTSLEKEHKKWNTTVGKFKTGETPDKKYQNARKAVTALTRTSGKLGKALDSELKDYQAQRDPVDIGWSGIGSNQHGPMVTFLERLAAGSRADLPEAHKKKLKKLIKLKDGDSQHPDSKLWQIGSVRGSIPTTAHTYGPGKKHLKTSHKTLTTALKRAGYV